jgi:hypothetical protein
VDGPDCPARVGVEPATIRPWLSALRPRLGISPFTRHPGCWVVSHLKFVSAKSPYKRLTWASYAMAASASVEKFPR